MEITLEARAEAEQTGGMLAAVDLGSNSFHMVIARDSPSGLVVVDRHRQRVQLAAGLDRHGHLAEDAMERALACLRQFGQRLAKIDTSRVRAVGTSTFRRTRDGGEFLAAATSALGHPIEILGGFEEGRLIYQGVASDLTEPHARRLVIDIGGGSTECVLGEGMAPIEIDSLGMGCVSMSRAHFPGGEIDKSRMVAAEVAAHREIATLASRYHDIGWSECVGSSGTITAIETILRENGWADFGITADGLRRLRRAMIRAGSSQDLKLPGLSRDRAPVLPGGVAILRAVFDALEVSEMQVSRGALREGVLSDLRGRIHDKDLREHTVDDIARRYHVEPAQASRVETAAVRLFDEVQRRWDLEQGRALLAWAARVHELGLAVAYSGHHRHGAYLLRHSDLPGFSRQEQGALASLVLGHRRKLSTKTFESLEPWSPALLLRLCVLLRLAVLLCRSRTDAPPVHCDVKAERIRLRFEAGWLDAHPLTRADLEEEARYLAKVGFQLAWGESARQRV